MSKVGKFDTIGTKGAVATGGLRITACLDAAAMNHRNQLIGIVIAALD
jgi:hypothetical protein